MGVLTIARRMPKAPGYPIIGEMTDGKALNIFTLEDPYILRVGSEAYAHIVSWPYLYIKVPGVTAIPAGKYRAYLTYSPRFGKNLPLLVNVPSFTDIRMHPLNVAEQSEGCVGVGLAIDANLRSISGSAVATDMVVKWFEKQTDEIWVDVQDIPREERMSLRAF